MTVNDTTLGTTLANLGMSDVRFPGWQLLAARGKTGDKGRPVPTRRKAMKGDRGDPALEVADWHVDAAGYRVTPFLSNAHPGKTIELRPFFQTFLDDIGGQT